MAKLTTLAGPYKVRQFDDDTCVTLAWKEYAASEIVCWFLVVSIEIYLQR
jgi:hypothetical protein